MLPIYEAAWEMHQKNFPYSSKVMRLSIASKPFGKSTQKILNDKIAKGTFRKKLATSPQPIHTP